jgi:hypothetical protein
MLIALGLLLLLSGSSSAAGGCVGGRAPVSGCGLGAIAPAADVEVEESEEGEQEAEEDLGFSLAGEEGEAVEEEGEGEAQAGGSSKGRRQVAISELRLTENAIAALKHHDPTESSIGFSFVLGAATKVHVTLSKQSTVHGRSRWTTLPGSVTLSAGKGAVRHNLGGHGKLSPGRYMLTAKPTTGPARSIYMSAHS